MARQRGDRGTRQEALNRRLKLLKFIKKYGIWNVHPEQWEKEYNVSKSTIKADLNWLRKHATLNTIDVEDIKFELHDGLKQLLAQARLKALSSENEGMRRLWSNTYARLSERFTRFLEDFGAKESLAPVREPEQEVVVSEDALEEALRAYKEALE